MTTKETKNFGESKFDIIYKEVLWVINNFSGDNKEPGSKAEDQAMRIATFVQQLETAEQLLDAHGLNLVRVTRW